jgi:hypothetical protein
MSVECMNTHSSLGLHAGRIILLLLLLAPCPSFFIVMGEIQEEEIQPDT